MLFRSEQKAAAMVGPIRQSAAEQHALGNLARAKTVTLKDGSRLASPESIDQVGKMLPPELLADSNVAALIPILAAGIDAVMGRRPATQELPDYGEPAFSEPSIRRSAPGAINEDTRALLQKTGVSEKDYAAASKAYQPGRSLALE